VRPQLSVAKIADFFLMCKKIDRNINKKMIFTKIYVGKRQTVIT
jgi:hypothetical protein